MADDGMLMNFDLGDAPLITQTSFKGGRWRDRLSAKKSQKFHETKGAAGPRTPREPGPRDLRPPASREIFRQVERAPEHEEYIGNSVPGRAPKRQRVDHNREIDGRNAVSASMMTGKLPAGSFGNIGGGNKKKFDDDEPPAKQFVVPVTTHTAPTYISGKLPPGSINLAVKNKKRFEDDMEVVAEPENFVPATKNYSAGKLPSGSIASGRPAGPGGKPAQIISSLFSFNPESKTKFEAPVEEVEEARPSNAPLSDEASTFVNMGVSKRLALHLSTKLEMKAPTAIQKAAVPQLISSDDDAFIQAETGSGKTLAYLLPIVERIMAMTAKDESNPDVASNQGQINRSSGVFAIVLAPTRELCKQIATVLDGLLRCAPWLVGTTVMGGESKSSEKARLRKGVNILVATPGRLSDHLDNTEVLNVSTVRWLVLDEGDRLMELGFEEEIKSIVERIGRRALAGIAANKGVKNGLPRRRVTVLCSATMKMNVQKLGEISLKDAVHIQAEASEDEATKASNDKEGVEDIAFSAPAQLKQAYTIVPAKLRLVTLTALLKRTFARRGSVMKAIIFISCADSVDFHFSLFSHPPPTTAPADSNPPALPDLPVNDQIKETLAWASTIQPSDNSNPILMHKLHGSLPQPVRTATLKSFSTTTHPSILICTDVASRGLDLPNIDYVIEYDAPFSKEDHLHRVGRTARAGNAGRACIFLMPGEEEGYISILASGYRQGQKALTHHTAEDLLRKGFGGTGHEWEERATAFQLDIEQYILNSPKYLEMARRGFQSYIRAYATHVAEERSIFDLKAVHLGHLAKAFGLRDKPGSIRIPGARPGKVTTADRKVAERKKARAAKDAREGKVADVGDVAPEGQMARQKRLRERDTIKEVDVNDAARRMKMKLKEHMAGASEFNIG